MTQVQQTLQDSLNNIDEQRQQIEEALKFHREHALEEYKHNQEIIESLDARIAEVERYESMNEFQKFWYRLMHRPSWL
ncbi:hypothetical protein [Rothia sp. LK2492]|uniref:hypothetical protein n=1 Tax=Rothia sp. LK2492 TaxID=3114370 RepID=UPI0034CDC9B8